MRLLNGLLNIVLILSAVFIIGGFLIPNEWVVSRSIMIHASPLQIYPFVNNFKEWDKWSPWNSSKDATLHYTYEGSDTGVGAKQSWTSDKMGKGWMEFTSADPQTGVSYSLSIDMGYGASNLQGNIALKQEGDETEVTWTDKGNSGKSFTKRWMSLMIKVMLGRNFDTGLGHLKSLVEKQ